MTDRSVLSEMVLEPGTGKALEVKAGQILRIEQIEGLQCVDFNCFNLHDYKEFMHCGRTRTVHGFHPTQGAFLWSAPPRERALMYILEDTVGRNDVLFPRCSAYVYESAYGFDAHTNCHDIQAEAQREYGLTPDDVHDSFNLFMYTEISRDGRATITRQDTKPGDHVDLLALVDVLAGPNVFRANVIRISNFALKPIKLTLFEATDADLAAAPKTPILKSQRTPRDFRNPTIKTDRRLTRDSSYVAEFRQYADPARRRRDRTLGQGGHDARRPSLARLRRGRRRCAARTSCSRGGREIPRRRQGRSAGDRGHEGARRRRARIKTQWFARRRPLWTKANEADALNARYRRANLPCAGPGANAMRIDDKCLGKSRIRVISISADRLEPGLG